ncbi:unnamed protein product [Sympodiomycopsis kandeliae]
MSQPLPPRGAGLSLGLPRSKREGPVSRSREGTTTAPNTNVLRSQEDAVIRSTDNDALTSRISALQTGYLDLSKDPFSEYFVYGQEISRGLRAQNNNNVMLNPPINRRPPIINIGTYLRCETLDQMIESFLLSSSTSKKQIISLGAGSDSRYWRIMNDSRLNQSLHHYLELDFAQNINQKLHCIEKFPPLKQKLLGKVQIQKEESSPALFSEKYTARSCDLREIAENRTRQDHEDVFGTLDPNVPTLILAECVLSYLPPKSSIDLLQHISKRINPGVMVVGISYEMSIAGQVEKEALGPFAKVMLRNLESRGLSLLGARAFSSAESHAERFRQAFQSQGDGDETTTQGASTLQSIWKALPAEAHDRLSRIEGLDEVEELELLLGCYSISWGTRQTTRGNELSDQFSNILQGKILS